MNDTNPMNNLIFSAQDIERSLQRIAAQIWEKDTHGDLALVGIRSRGATLAERLHGRLETLANRSIPRGVLDIALYRDDIALNPVAPEVRSTEIDFDIEGKDIVLVDDVLFTGRTVRAALNALSDLGRPRRVQLMVLVDRGHRELPIQADFVGQKIQTCMKDNVSVRLSEEDGEDAVYIVRNQ